MDAVEFIQAHDRMCAYHEKNCGDCPARHMDSCGMGTKNPELLVDIVRKWTAEHCEVGKADESRNVLELMVALTDKVDRLAEKIKVAEKMIEESRFVTDATFGEVDERFAEVDAQIALCMRENSGAGKAEQKRTNKDVLVAVFPDARMDYNGLPDMCPLVLDTQYDCNAFASCSLCKRTHWLAEVEE